MSQRLAGASAFVVLATLAACRVAPSGDTRKAQPPEPPPPPSASAAGVDTSASGAGGTSGSGGGAGAPGTSGSGGAGGASIEGPCPAEMALVGRACVDRWEAHLVVVASDGTTTDWPHYERPDASKTYAAKSEPGVYPQGYISRVEAAAACKEAGKRLCSMNEWLRACQGKRWTMYPYGPRFVANACNVAKPHLLSQMFGSDGRAWKYDENFNSPQLDQEPGFLAKTGEYEQCASEDGVYDLVGNLHEWVRDSVDQDLVDHFDAEPIERRHQPWHEGNGLFLGGFFSTLREHGPGCKFITIAHEPKYHDYSTGFRCCEDAKLPKPEKAAKKR